MMASITMQRPREHESDSLPIKAIWQVIKQQLEAKKAANRAEILTYPRPITACDAQFNYLLEERNHIAQELQALEVAMHEQETGDIGRVEAFVNSSRYVNETTLLPVDRRHGAATREHH